MKKEIKLLHDMASELELAFSSYDDHDYCIEIPATDARKLLRRYEKWRKLLANPKTETKNEKTLD